MISDKLAETAAFAAAVAVAAYELMTTFTPALSAAAIGLTVLAVFL